MYRISSRRALIIALSSIGLVPVAAAQSNPPPKPTVAILSPTDGDATNAASMTVVVTYEAWVDPETGEVGNVQDVDLLVNGNLVETIPHRPPVTEGTDSFEVDLSVFSEEAIVLQVRAFQGSRRAGLFGISGAVTVVVDRTAPEIDLTWPRLDPFATDRSAVEIEGQATDNLSGVAEVELVAPAAVELTHPLFSTEQPLATGIPAGQVSVPTEFTLSATDKAGNAATKTFTVQYTEESTVPFIDPDSFVEIEDLVVSPRHAFIVFSDQAVATDRHPIVEEFGGRIMGFLTHLDVALAVFDDCQDVYELGTILDSLIAKYGVEINEQDNLVSGAQLYYLLEPRSLDNDALTATQARAYTNAKTDDASDWIEANVPVNEIRQVTTAVLDTGLNADFGVSGEFAGMLFIDAAPDDQLSYFATLEPEPPEDLSIGHGSLVASTLAGANNGFGNNGAGTLQSGPPVQVIVYRIFRDHWYSSEPLVDTYAMAAAANDAIARGVDVANMSFGAQSSPLLLSIIGFDRDVFRRIFSRGVDTLWVLAAGNDGTEVDRDIGCQAFCNIELPTVVSSEYQNVIAVANHNPATDLLASSSNFDDSNESIQISAPGTNVYAANGVGTYNYWNGTSASAPIVSGAAALLLAISDVTARDVKDILVATGRTMPASNPHPGLDALAAVQLGQGLTGARPVSGRGNGSQGANWEIPFASTPALNGFGFDFIGGDHHIEVVKVELDATRADVTYADKNEDDEYSWFVEGAPLPSGTLYNRYPTIGTLEDGGGCVTSEVLPESGMGTFVLTGFEMDFVGGDHHIDELGVVFKDYPEGTRIELCYNDKNDDDNFTWAVSYAVVPQASVVDSGSTGDQFVDPAESETTESLNLGLNLMPGDLPVIRGFEFDLEDDDQHLKKLSVDISSVGVVHVKFRDETAGGLFFGLNDEYTWSVDWAVVSP